MSILWFIKVHDRHLAALPLIHVHMPHMSSRKKCSGRRIVICSAVCTFCLTVLQPTECVVASKLVLLELQQEPALSYRQSRGKDFPCILIASSKQCASTMCACMCCTVRRNRCLHLPLPLLPTLVQHPHTRDSIAYSCHLQQCRHVGCHVAVKVQQQQQL